MIAQTEMKALVKAAAKPGLEFLTVPVPEIGPNDVLIKVKRTSLCGTDIHIYNWDEWAAKTVPVPLTTGHEYMGVIAAMGAAVEGYTIGQRVTGEGHIVCNVCRKCRGGLRHPCPYSKGIGVNLNGAFAEYVRLPASNLCALPDFVPDDLAAIFDPLGNAVHTALSFDVVGEDVLITGAGPIGIMAAIVCRHVGARNVVITDMHPYRLELAKKVSGANAVVDISKEKLEDAMQACGIKIGFDVGLEMSGSPAALQSMIGTITNGGKIALLGILPNGAGIDWEKVIFKGLTIKGIYGREMFETWYKMQAMVGSGLNISPIITHHFAARDFTKAFDVMKSGQSGKVILNWDEI